MMISILKTLIVYHVNQFVGNVKDQLPMIVFLVILDFISLLKIKYVPNAMKLAKHAMDPLIIDVQNAQRATLWMIIHTCKE